MIMSFSGVGGVSFLRAAPAAYRSSQARDRIRAVVAGLATATATRDPNHV